MSDARDQDLHLRSGIGDMQPDRLLVAEVESRGTSIPQGGERTAYDRILEQSVPGVSALAGTDVMPMIYMGFTTRTLDIAGYEPPAGVPVERSGFGARVIYRS